MREEKTGHVAINNIACLFYENIRNLANNEIYYEYVSVLIKESIYLIYSSLVKMG